MGVRSELDANFDFEIVDEFLDHYTMMVESMEVMIMDLEKPNRYKRSVDELFRVFHNIKSASGYLKITSMSKLSAFVEDALEELRGTEELASSEVVSWLLAISDTYAQWLEDLRADNELTHIKFELLKLPSLEK
ncbi:chemotaxis protein CheA [Sulfurimonas hongkongensis]|uniref:Chemotaxis protein CheA n=1 Tax=Sulfurimonas hongkongensis TaxID=1172190 RepID=T0JPE7_9BACT|nr:Hpt domain-containing protein [Sulfurimonas hongkongensis]EQB40056.1 chemotaxis protein CheA [Sulfurimonas hongkongensis]